MDFLGPSFPLNEGEKINREIHSKIHDKIPAKSTHVVKNGVGNSTLQEEGPDIAFGTLQFMVPKCYYRLGKKDKGSLDSLI